MTDQTKRERQKAMIADLRSYDEGAEPADGWWVAFNDLQKSADTIESLIAEIDAPETGWRALWKAEHHKRVAADEKADAALLRLGKIAELLDKDGMTEHPDDPALSIIDSAGYQRLEEAYEIAIGERVVEEPFTHPWHENKSVVDEGRVTTGENDDS